MCVLKQMYFTAFHSRIYMFTHYSGVYFDDGENEEKVEEVWPWMSCTVSANQLEQFVLSSYAHPNWLITTVFEVMRGKEVGRVVLIVVLYEWYIFQQTIINVIKMFVSPKPNPLI